MSPLQAQRCKTIETDQLQIFDVSPTTTSLIVFASVFGGSMLGMAVRRRLPKHHLTDDSKGVVQLGMGLVATMTALVLALLIASAKSSHDLQNEEVIEISVDFMVLDRTLSRYGVDANRARGLLPGALRTLLDQTWRGSAYRSESLDRALGTSAEPFFDQLRQLQPRDDFERALYGQIMEITFDLGHKRSLLLEQSAGSIPMPFVVVMIIWLALIFASFGLFAPTNSTVISVLLACALSVAGAVFLILEMDRPFQGLIQISSAPLKNALVQIAK